MNHLGTGKSIYVFFVLAAAITAATWALGVLDIKYEFESNHAFADGFPGDLAQWSRAGDWSNIEFTTDKITVHRNTEDKSYAKRQFDLPFYENRSQHNLRITGTIETENLVEPSPDNRGAAYMIWLENDEGEVLRYLTIQNLTGDRKTYQAERIISIPNDIRSFTLVLNSRESKNSFSLKDASAETISVTSKYQLASRTLLGCWILVFLICGFWLLKHASRPLFITTAALLGIIVVGVLLPESITGPYIDPLFHKIASAFISADNPAAQYTYKFGHFLFFFLASLALLLNAKSLPITQLQIVLFLVLLALASEAMQLHLFNRTTRLLDLGIDFLGILLGWLIAAVFSRGKSTQ